MKHTYTITRKSNPRRRLITLDKAPEEDGELFVKFKGSRGWRKTHPGAEPLFKLEAAAGQTEFAYPKGLKENSIVEIYSE